MTHKFTRFLTLGAFLAAASVLPLGAVTLGSLIGSTQATGLVVGNVDYYNFSFSTSCFVGGVGTSCSSLVTSGNVNGIDPTGITVTAASGIPAGEQGFQITTPLSVTSNGQNVVLDVTLTYDATVVGSSSLISDVYLAGADTFNPPTGSNPPSISVGETVTSSTGTFLGKVQISDPPANLANTIVLTPAVSSIIVTKDISLQSGAGSSGGQPDTADLTTLIQATSLTPTPEPRAYAFMLVGFFGAFVAIQRRRRQTA